MNKQRVIEEFEEWINNEYLSSEEACDKSDIHSSSYIKYLEKCRTLSLVRDKFIELKYK